MAIGVMSHLWSAGYWQVEPIFKKPVAADCSQLAAEKWSFRESSILIGVTPSTGLILGHHLRFSWFKVPAPGDQGAWLLGGCN